MEINKKFLDNITDFIFAKVAPSSAAKSSLSPGTATPRWRSGQPGFGSRGMPRGYCPREGTAFFREALQA